MNARINTKAKYLILIPLALIIAIYAYSLTFNLINLDDHHLLRELSEIENFDHLVDKAFNSQYLSGGYFRPLVTMTVWFDLQIGSGGFFFLHFTNILIHILSVYIFFLIILKVFRSYKIALIVSLLFAIHPINVNAVSWILGRNDLLVGLFVLLSFHLFIKYIEKPSIIILLLHILSFFLAVLSKETGSVLPAVCIAYLYLFSKKKLFSLNTLFFLFSWSLVILIWYLLRENAIGSHDKEILSIEYFFDNIRIIPEFIGKFFLPADITVLPSFRSFNTWVGLVAMVSMIAASILNKKSNRKMFLFGFIWFFVFTVPGMFSLIFTDNDFFNYFDCRSYLPLSGLFISFISLLPQKMFDFRKKTFCAIILIIALSLSIISILEARYYASPLKYWTKAVREEPQKARYWFELGINARNAGQYAAAEKFILKATELNPTRPEFYLSLGEMMIKIGDLPKAEGYLLNSIERYPTWAPPQIKLAEVLYKQKKFHNAINIIELTFSNIKVISELIPNLIRSHIILKQYDLAVLKLEKYSNHLSKNDVSDLFVYIGVQAIADNSEIAVYSWKKSLEFNNSNLDALMNLKQYYSMVDKEKAAIYNDMINSIKNSK
jgi:tetratricopeptide (TPR) repeat protein